MSSLENKIKAVMSVGVINTEDNIRRCSRKYNLSKKWLRRRGERMAEIYKFNRELTEQQARVLARDIIQSKNN